MAWGGASGDFVRALLKIGFLDYVEETYLVHDWADHNPWAFGDKMRSEKARWAAIKRHHGEEEADKQIPAYAARRAAGNAPAPLRSPAPSLAPAPSSAQSLARPTPKNTVLSKDNSSGSNREFDLRYAQIVGDYENGDIDKNEMDFLLARLGKKYGKKYTPVAA